MAGKKNQIDKVVLAYSGGLDTSIIIPWLKENYGCEVVAVCVDLGQGEELGSLEDKAIRTGASKLYILDLKREFITDFIFRRFGRRHYERYIRNSFADRLQKPLVGALGKGPAVAQGLRQRAMTRSLNLRLSALPD